jgi:hypothetical protein
MRNLKHYCFFLGSVVLAITACNNPASQQESPAAPTVAQAPKNMAPFRYQKTIQVAPGQYYDVLAWGRGSETIGAFEILRSDSASMKYTTTTGDLEGKIVDVFNSDMDTDGNPEIFIHTQAADSTNAATVFAFEYKDNTARKLDFPRLTRSQRKGYRGNDRFFLRDGDLMREFDVYREDDTLAKTPLQKRLIQYSLRGNSLSADQVSKDDSTATNSSSAGSGGTEATSTKNEKRETSTSNHSSTRKRSSSKGSSSKRTSKKSSSKKESSKSKRRRHRS